MRQGWVRVRKRAVMKKGGRVKDWWGKGKGKGEDCDEGRSGR